MATTSSIPSSPINIQDFLRILVAQLNYQDPLKPMDNDQFVTQLAQFTSLQQSQNLNDKMESLLLIQGAMQSIGLLGRSVEVNDGGTKVSGKVTALSFANGEPRLSVALESGKVLTDVSLSTVTSIH